jgi:uncharacterized protein
MTLTESQATYAAAVDRLWTADGAHDLGHLARVWANCQRIAESEPGADLAVLLAAAYFHDVVNLPKTSADRSLASVKSADLAVTVLPGLGFDNAKLSAVHHAIAAHSFSAGIPPQTLDARILQDADRLEALGAVGIARMFHVGGAMGGAMFDADDPLAQRRPLDDRRYALDHLEVKLFPVAAAMQTAAGRQMAEERAEWMSSFRTRLLAELG